MKRVIFGAVALFILFLVALSSLVSAESQDNYDILFNSTFESDDNTAQSIYAIKLKTNDGIEYKRHTHGSSDWGASWAPDKKHFVFTSSADGHPQLFIMDSSNGQIRQLTNTPGRLATSPVWSPQGNIIAFASSETNSLKTCISLIYIDGTDNQDVVCHATQHLDYPAWSPDGLNLLYTRFGQEINTYKIDVKGTDDHLLLEGAFPAVYSPDGQKIAFSRKDGGGVDQLFIANADGTNERQLNPGFISRRIADWSPDGTKLLINTFMPFTGSVSEIHIVDLNGENDETLVNKLSNSWAYEGSWR